MEIVGVAAEYNPFHRGHELHLARTRRAFGEDAAFVCVLSGDFVQRGEAAVFSKHARAEAACRCGADLAVELPLPWSLSSAEGFARGAVRLLGGLGCTAISFGSEAGELEPLEELARELVDPELQSRVKAKLAADATLSYAAARQLAAADRLGAEKAALLGQPNNILAVEYLKAAHELRLPLRPFTMARQGSGHDASGGELLSAMAIRRLLYEGEDVSSQIPEGAAAVYEREIRCGRAPVDRQALETALLARLRALREEDFEALPDGGDGLGLRLCRAAKAEPTLDAVLAAAGTKRYALARLRRMLCCAALGLRSEDLSGLPPYARVLAATERGREVLRAASRSEGLPILTKPAAVRELPADCLRVFELGANAHDLWALGCPAAEERRGGGDWRASPVIIRNSEFGIRNEKG